MAKLKRIGVLSLAKLEAVLMALVGLIAGLFFVIIGTTFGAIAGTIPLGVAGLGFLAIIVTPIFYGIFGFIAGAVGALIYNLIASWIGGIELEFER